MSEQNQKTEKPTKVSDEEINRIDGILNQLDELMKQLPEDYQRNYANDILDWLNIEEE